MIRRANVQVVLSVLVFLFAGSLAYTQNAPPPQPVQQLSVWDSRGKLIGHLVGLQFQLTYIALRVQSRVLILGVGSQIFFGSEIGTSSPPLYFDSGDCTGTAYFEPNNIFDEGMLPPPIHIVSPERKVYVPDGSPQTRLLGSALNLAGGPPQHGRCDPAPAGFELSVTPLRLFVDLNNYFTPPFTIR